MSATHIVTVAIACMAILLALFVTVMFFVAGTSIIIEEVDNIKNYIRHRKVEREEDGTED